MISRPIRILAVAFGLSGLLARAAESEAASDPFRDGARWCFVGDALTQRSTYLTWFQAYVVTRFPDRTIDVVNAGIDGDTAVQALPRFSWDVAGARPHAVVLAFLGSEAIPGALDSAPHDALQTWVTRIRAIDSVPWILGSAARDGGVREFARSADARFVDVSAALAQLPAGGGTGGQQAPAGTPVAGHIALAAAILKAAAAPTDVATLSIDLRSARFTATNSMVDRVVRAPTELTFQWTAKALPWPISAALRQPSGGPSIEQELNRETLQVQGLRAGHWTLSVDGAVVGDFTHTQLESGINLAGGLATPQNRQARDVLRLLEAHARLIAENVRPVAAAEHKLAPDEPRPISSERILELMSVRRAAGEGLEFDREPFILYQQRKSRQTASLLAAGRLLMQARRAAQPYPHLYVLRLTK